MTSRTLRFVVGAPDPERNEIVRLILANNAGSITYAQCRGEPVDPGTAYRADPIYRRDANEIIVLIECCPRNLIPDAKTGVLLIDHHRPGDPGWDAPPVEYWAGSSLGQLMQLLGLTANRYQRALAAMDHCFAAALRGECPGAPRKVVLQLKINEIANAHGVSSWKVGRLIRHAKRALQVCDSVGIGTERVLDYRSVHLGLGYSLNLLTVQVAATLLGRTVLLRHSDPSGREKMTLAGSVAPSTVDAFLNDWARDQGLVDQYGVPNRGYAGGYFE